MPHSYPPSERYSHPGGVRSAVGQSPYREDTLSRRRQELHQRQHSWRRNLEEDPYFEMSGSDCLDMHTVPSQRELSILYQAFATPELGDDSASPKQLIQLLHSNDNKVVLFALKEIAGRLEQDDMDLSHLVSAMQPMVAVLLRGDGTGGATHSTEGGGRGRNDACEVYWAVLFVLQQLCLEDRHAMAIGDIGGPKALLTLLDDRHDFEPIPHTIITHILNTIWLLCCYEGNGDLARYDEARGPIPALVSLLCQLRENEERSYDPDHSTEGDPLLTVLCTLECISRMSRYRGQITSEGGIEHCVPLLSHGKVSHRITALRVAHNLMVDNSLEFVVLGGVVPLCAMLASSNKAENAAAVRTCVHLFGVRGDLGSLVADMVGSGCCGACSVLMRGADAAVARRAIILVGLLCQYGTEDYSYLLFKEKGFIKGVVTLLKSDKLATLLPASAMFWYLTRVEEAQQTLISSGAIPRLQYIFSRASEVSLLHNVGGALKRLECFDDIGDNLDLLDPSAGSAIRW